jgi:hypothetical protein
MGAQNQVVTFPKSEDLFHDLSLSVLEEGPYDVYLCL